MVSGVAMAALAALVVPTAAQAQTESQAQVWPQRPVRFIVGLGPGSAQDIAARLFGEQLSKRWGQPVVIENKPGADGIVAINAFTGAHDPHTLLFAASGTFTAHPTQYAKLPYDPSDLVPLARVSSTIIAVSVPTALNVNSLDELVALARKEPGKLNLVPTPGTTEITFDNFLKTSGVTMTKIPYSDVTKALADLAENRVQVMVAGIALVKSQVETGKVKILAITNLKRAAAVPDLPTGTEAGYPALALDGLIGLFGPRNLPPGTAERIAADVQAVAADPAIGPRLAATATGSSPRRHRGVRGGRGRAAQEHRRHRQGPGDPADAIARSCVSRASDSEIRDLGAHLLRAVIAQGRAVWPWFDFALARCAWPGHTRTWRYINASMPDAGDRIERSTTP
jgi:tripartite-type tricarboxylate transporter receptor subunit TctC